VLTTGQLTLHGTGRESRDFIHAVDIARALSLLATAAPARGEVYNLANGNEVTITELANLLLKALDSTAVAQFDGVATPGNPLQWHADIAKIRALGFAPSITLEQGIRQVAVWCAAELSATR
jgi:UDP-glucose 4-epimerase